MPSSDSSAAKAIFLKRAYAPPEAADGVRVLVDRLWPRGVSKDTAKLDAWMAPLGPSDELRIWFGHQPDRWTAFTEKYRAELETPLRRTLLAALQGVGDKSTLTLIYGARDTRENEAIVVRWRLLQDREQPAVDWGASTKLLAVMAVVAAAHRDAIAPTSGVELFAASLLTANEIADAQAELTRHGLLRVVPGGWRLTLRAHQDVHQLAAQRSPVAVSR